MDNSPRHFTQMAQVLACCHHHFYSSFLCVCVCVCVYSFFSELFESKLPLCPLISCYVSPKEKGMFLYNHSPVIKSRELNTATCSLFSSSAGLPRHALYRTSPRYRAQVRATCSSLFSLHLQNSCWVLLSFSPCLQFLQRQGSKPRGQTPLGLSGISLCSDSRYAGRPGPQPHDPTPDPPQLHLCR